MLRYYHIATINTCIHAFYYVIIRCFNVNNMYAPCRRRSGRASDAGSSAWRGGAACISKVSRHIRCLLMLFCISVSFLLFLVISYHFSRDDKFLKELLTSMLTSHYIFFRTPASLPRSFHTLLTKSWGGRAPESKHKTGSQLTWFPQFPFLPDFWGWGLSVWPLSPWSLLLLLLLLLLLHIIIKLILSRCNHAID